MSDWSLTKLLETLHDDIHQKLETARKAFAHPVTKGDTSERIWLELFRKYLPKRYQAEKGFVVDSNGKFSQQIDIVIFDRQYSPFIFNYEGEVIIPSESVYAVFEAKQTINYEFIRYAQEKIGSVRSLHRTSLPIPHAGGTYPPKSPIQILGGILTLESDWSPTIGEPLRTSLEKKNGCLNLGCIASHGYFNFNEKLHKYEFFEGNKPATAFLFKLIALLQFSGTVPMIDIGEYSKWLICEEQVF